MTKPSPGPAPSDAADRMAKAIVRPLPCKPRDNTAEEAVKMRFLASMTELLPEGEPK